MTENAVATEDEWLAGVLPPKEIELLSIALDASFAHMFALKAGARVEEIFGVLKLCIVQAVQVCNLGVPILEEELARMEGNRASR
jgi:alkylhydroperoxidase/carboxymuconolactone decarboxylase family protein YurZ